MAALLVNAYVRKTASNLRAVREPADVPVSVYDRATNVDAPAHDSAHPDSGGADSGGAGGDSENPASDHATCHKDVRGGTPAHRGRLL